MKNTQTYKVSDTIGFQAYKVIFKHFQGKL